MSKINGFAFISPDKWRFLNNAEVEQSAHRANEYAERNFYFDNLEYRIEEYLRQWMLAQLTDVYGYPENWLWVAKNAKRNANVVIKDESNRTLALVAARYFGETDLEFEQAGHELQSDLEEIATVRFGLVTDGRRIAFICKNGDDQIGDYKTIADFPVYDELKKFLETNQLPNLPLTTQKFQKLPASQRPAKPLVAVRQKPADKRLSSHALSRFKTESGQRRKIAAILSVILLILLGAWYVTRSEPTVDAQQSATTTAATSLQTEKKDAVVVNPRLTGQTSSPGRSASPAARAAEQKTTRAIPTRAINADGSIKLSRDEASLMQSRPASNPNVHNQQSKVAVQPASPDEVPLSGRKIIRQPFTQPN